MSFHRWCVAALCLAPVPGWLPAQSEATAPTLVVRVDSARHELVLTIGPFDLPGRHAGHDMSGMPGSPGLDSMPGMAMTGGHDEASMPTFSATFTWPVNALGRGYHVQLVDGDGRRVSLRVLHHLNLINADRRQLLLPLDERILAVGRESENLLLPKTVGMPLRAGARMKARIMWDNQTPVDILGLTMTLGILYSPTNMLPEPVPVLPISLDVADGIGRSNTFTIPPGEFTASREFVMPVDGWVLGVSGHLHDWGVALRLEDAASGKVLTRLAPTLDSAGRVVRMPRHLFGIAGDGLRLRANRRYRIVAVYRNPTGFPIPGAMGHIDGLFHPRDLSRMPAKGDTSMAYLDNGVQEEPQGSISTPVPHH